MNNDLDSRILALRKELSVNFFASSLGGAILGMLLTLLVLAVINGGTLSFSHDRQDTIILQKVVSIDQNVGAINSNLEKSYAELLERIEKLEAQQ